MSKERIKKNESNRSFAALLTLFIINYKFSQRQSFNKVVIISVKCLNKEVHIYCTKEWVKSKIKKMKTERGVYKTRNRGTGNGMRGMRGIFQSIPGNVLILIFQVMVEKIPGNVREDSGEYLRRFQETFKKIPGNAIKDSGEWYQKFLRMFKKIPGNAIKDFPECSRRFQGMSSKIPGNAINDSRECSRRFRGMSSKIPGNAIKDSRECSRRFRGIFRKILGNAFNFKLIKVAFFLKKQMLSYSRRCDLSLLYLMKQQKDQTK